MSLGVVWSINNVTALRWRGIKDFVTVVVQESVTLRNGCQKLLDVCYGYNEHYNGMQDLS